jgi:cytochrome P450
MLRRARHDLHLADCSITAGQAVLLVCGAANRDPAAFPDPDRLALQRPTGRHVAVGYGPHFCLGAALARLQGAVVRDTFTGATTSNANTYASTPSATATYSPPPHDQQPGNKDCPRP